MTHPPDALSRDLQLAVQALDAGGVIAVPTDTVYGLACRSAFPDAVQRIFALKRRPPEKALPFLLAAPERIADFVNVVPRRARRLVEAFWPVR